jgi:hypothetical protein
MFSHNEFSPPPADDEDDVKAEISSRMFPTALYSSQYSKPYFLQMKNRIANRTNGTNNHHGELMMTRGASGLSVVLVGLPGTCDEVLTGFSVVLVEIPGSCDEVTD